MCCLWHAESNCETGLVNEVVPLTEVNSITKNVGVN